MAKRAHCAKTGSFTADPTELTDPLGRHSPVPEHVGLRIDDSYLIASSDQSGTYFSIVLSEGRFVVAPCDGPRCETGCWRPRL